MTSPPPPALDRRERIYACIDVRARDYKFNILAKLLLDLWFPDVQLDLHQVDQQVKHAAHGHFDRLGYESKVYVTTAYNVTRMRDTLSRAYHMGATIVHTHTEQFSESSLFDEKLNLQHKQEYLGHVSRHFVWENFADLLINLVGISPANIYLVGNPRLELMRMNFGVAVPSDYLFISDFSLADFDDAEYGRFRKLYQIPDGVDHRALYTRTRGRFLDWIRCAAARAASSKIIVRLHPSENSAVYVQALADLRNVEISDSGDIDSLIKGAKVCFGYTTSTVFEAVAAGKPFYALALEKLPATLDQKTYAHYPWIDKAQFEARLQEGAFRNNAQELATTLSYSMYGLGSENTLHNYVLALYECLRSAEPVKTRLTVADRWGIATTDVRILIKDLILKMNFMLSSSAGLKVPRLSEKLEHKTRGYYSQDRHFTDFETGYYYRDMLDTFRGSQRPRYRVEQCAKFKKFVFEPS